MDGIGWGHVPGPAILQRVTYAQRGWGVFETVEQFSFPPPPILRICSPIHPPPPKKKKDGPPPPEELNEFA